MNEAGILIAVATVGFVARRLCWPSCVSVSLNEKSMIKRVSAREGA